MIPKQGGRDGLIFLLAGIMIQFIILGEQFGSTRSALLPEYYNLRGGTFYGSFSSPLYHQYRYGISKIPLVSYTPKPIPAQLPVSKTFDIEIMKPMSQLSEKKTVPLYIVPQNSIHVFPHVQKIPAVPNRKLHFQPSSTTIHQRYQKFEFSSLMNNPSHLPAIEIPLLEPMLIETVYTDVLAPSGFNVGLKGPFGNSLPYPIYTVALLAPVPVGTIVSRETPVILTTIYAIPSLPFEPSYYPILAQFPSNMMGVSKGTKIQQSIKNTFISEGGDGSSNSISTSTQKTTTSVVPVPVSNHHHDNNIFVTYPDENGIGYPETSFPSSVPTPPTTIFQEVLGDENDAVSPAGIISGTAPEFTPKPFINSKESPYLQELREQSIRSQIAELQDLLHSLTSSRSQ